MCDRFYLGFLQSLYRWHCNSTNKLADFERWENVIFLLQNVQAAGIWPGLKDSTTTSGRRQATEGQVCAPPALCAHHNPGLGSLHWTLPSASTTSATWAPKGKKAACLTTVLPQLPAQCSHPVGTQQMFADKSTQACLIDQMDRVALYLKYTRISSSLFVLCEKYGLCCIFLIEAMCIN